MKKILLLIITVQYSIFSQDLLIKTSDNYNFSYESSVQNIEDIVKNCESFNSFIDKELKLSRDIGLRDILVFKTKTSYNYYLQSIGVKEREDYILIQYSNNSSKLIIYLDEEDPNKSLNYHLILQYMDFYASDAPYWFTIGISTYYESNNRSNWIDLLQRTNNKENIFTTLLNSDRESIKPYHSWIVIDFLINSKDKGYNRLLWDTLSYIKYSDQENKEQIINRNFSTYKLDKDLYAYLLEQKGYEEYMNIGIDQYQNKEFEKAIKNFLLALKLEENQYSPEYYIALCYSQLEDYNRSNSHFTLSLDKGAPRDVVYYSIGINYFKERNFKQAKKYLDEIEDKMYIKMAEEVLNEIRKY